MRLHAVESEMLSEVGYDPANLILQVKYRKTNTSYKYKDVPLMIFGLLMSSMSIGKAMHAYILKEYEYEKVLQN